MPTSIRSKAAQSIVLAGVLTLASLSATSSLCAATPGKHPAKAVHARQLAHPHALIGTWRAVPDANPQLHPGTLTFERSGQAQVAPDGFIPLAGTWKATADAIEIVVPDRGTAHLTYQLSGKPLTLTVRYDSGLSQRFTLESSATGHTP